MQGKRYALPNTRIMLHHPSGSARGQASDINNEARELMRLRNYVNQVLSQATGQPIEKVCTPFAYYCCTIFVTTQSFKEPAVHRDVQYAHHAGGANS